MPKLLTPSTESVARFKSRSLFLGIDPGASGGLAVVSDIGVDLVPMPGTEQDVWQWLDARGKSIGYAMIEKIDPFFPKISKASAAKLFGGYTALRMAITAIGVPFEEVKAGDWQRYWKIEPRRKSETTNKWKTRLCAKAQQIFPRLAVWNETKKVQLSVCDALLIAEACRRIRA